MPNANSGWLQRSWKLSQVTHKCSALSNTSRAQIKVCRMTSLSRPYLMKLKQEKIRLISRTRRLRSKPNLRPPLEINSFHESKSMMSLWLKKLRSSRSLTQLNSRRFSSLRFRKCQHRMWIKASTCWIRWTMTRSTTWSTWCELTRPWCASNMRRCTVWSSQISSLSRWWLSWRQIPSDKAHKWQKITLICSGVHRKHKTDNESPNPTKANLLRSHLSNNSKILSWVVLNRCLTWAIWRRWWITPWLKRWWIIRKWWDRLWIWWTGWGVAQVVSPMQPRCRRWWRIPQCLNC